MCGVSLKMLQILNHPDYDTPSIVLLISMTDRSSLVWFRPVKVMV